MNTLVWIVQGLLAFLFCTSGLLLLSQPKEKLAPKMPFVNDYSPAMVKLVAFAHIFGAMGLTLPQLFHIYPVLTPVAACCLAVVMILAMRYNRGRQDRKGVITDLIIGTLFLFIAYYRYQVQD